MNPKRSTFTPAAREDRAFVRQLSLEKKEEKSLAIEGHTVHFDLPEDQGRMVNQTLYIANEGEQVSSLAKKELRDESHAYMKEHMRGIMQGMTMFVGFYPPRSGSEPRQLFPPSRFPAPPCHAFR